MRNQFTQIPAYEQMLNTKSEIGKNPTVVEICAGMGGTRAGLTAANFEIIQSIDLQAEIVDFHRYHWGEADQLDVTSCDFSMIKSADGISAGFPCQPFSTSGYRTGFLHEQGNVFSSLIELIKTKGYKFAFLENVTGLLQHEGGKTFKIIISELGSIYNTVEWVTTNLLDIDVPQNRDRVIIFAHHGNEPLLASYTPQFFHLEQSGLFQDSIPMDELLNHPDSLPQFGTLINKEWLKQSGHRVEKKYKYDLYKFIFNDAGTPFPVRSGRFWARTGKTIFYTSENNYSHNIGASLGNAPTFATEPELVQGSVADQINSVSNWTLEHSGHFVFRLKPELGLQFFGKLAVPFASSISTFKAPLALKYKMLGNMFAPDHAFHILSHIRSKLKI